MISFKDSNKIHGVKIITPEIYQDFRGSNFEAYNKKSYDIFVDEYGNSLKFIQESISTSKQNTLRGLHGDLKTWKIIQCYYGTIYFVIVDIRPSSPTYKKHETFTLSDENKLQILLPAGFVNGHLCMSKNCIFSYRLTEQFTSHELQKHINCYDPNFNIYWPIKNVIITESDVNLKTNI